MSKIITEAFSVYRRTGLTPGQMEKRAKELEAVVRAALKTAQIEEQPFRNWHNQAVDILSKSLPNTVAETPSGQEPAAGSVAEPIGYALAYPNGKPIFSFSGPNLRTSLAEAQEMSRLHLGSGEPIAVYTAAPTPADQGDARRAAILEVRALIDSNRCDGESEWARGINEARKVNLQRIDAVLAQKEQSP